MLFPIRRSPDRLAWLVLSLAVAAAGCRDDAVSPGDPTGPDVASAATSTAAAALTFSQISAGNDHSCGVAGGQAYCWGANDFGNLGNGTANASVAPVAVVGGLQFADVRAAVTHSCGLTTDGLAYCWGDNEYGQLGAGNLTTPRYSPVAVAGGHRFTQLRVGFRHACGLTAAGVAWCWGANPAGELGTGTKTGPEVCSGLACSTRPVRVGGGHVFRQIRAGGEHSCGLDTDRRLWCWGSNAYGGLGDGTRTERLTPVPVAGGLLFAQVSVGAFYSCGVTPAHAAWCWGYNASGQLGDGSTTARLRPTKVKGGLEFGGVSAGVGHSCGVTTLKQAYCWGDNQYAQLGDGTTTERHVPTAVQGGLFWEEVLAGWRPTCGRVTSGKGYCWGEEGVGDGTGLQRRTPTPVAPPS